MIRSLSYVGNEAGTAWSIGPYFSGILKDFFDVFDVIIGIFRKFRPLLEWGSGKYLFSFYQEQGRTGRDLPRAEDMPDRKKTRRNDMVDDSLEELILDYLYSIHSKIRKDRNKKNDVSEEK
jgi:hypothetical protein